MSEPSPAERFQAEVCNCQRELSRPKFILSLLSIAYLSHRSFFKCFVSHIVIESLTISLHGLLRCISIITYGTLWWCSFSRGMGRGRGSGKAMILGFMAFSTSRALSSFLFPRASDSGGVARSTSTVRPEVNIRIRQRSVLEFLFKSGYISATVIHSKIKSVYGNEAMDRGTMQRWIQCFQTGDFDISDKVLKYQNWSLSEELIKNKRIHNDDLSNNRKNPCL
ncbi:hypothetical protein LAZ67_16002305 [Cordylochernes scorpioides]|uniref:Mos1 transposase HTH domain-containing protein n=1 Tax=Cordylochernes scorpioides TaxID=51811 RepID=A0ABY6LBW4_9ARAC|nr:hypothetical protein LAZ67_16002305 [Cordylochernes scorpioides]